MNIEDGIRIIETSDPLRDPRVLALRHRLRSGLTAEAAPPGEVERIVREIIADRSAPPAWVAADLVAQAEHNPGAAVLVTTSLDLARAVRDRIGRHLEPLARRQAAARCLRDYGSILVVPDLEAACDVANDLACEHVQVMTARDEAVLARLRSAGAIFVGRCSPVPLGDYVAGPSHVLPTGGTARFFGPLTCNDFRRMTSIIRYDSLALAEDAADVAAFADLEGLAAHAESIRIRQR